VRRGGISSNHNSPGSVWHWERLAGFAASGGVWPQDASVPEFSVPELTAYLQYRAPETCSLQALFDSTYGTMVAYRSEAIVTGKEKTAWSRPSPTTRRDRDDHIRTQPAGQVIKKG